MDWGQVSFRKKAQNLLHLRRKCEWQQLLASGKMKNVNTCHIDTKLNLLLEIAQLIKSRAAIQTQAA